MLNVGIKGTKTEKVVKENTAEAVGSGMLPVYATPMMIALIEATASQSVAPFLEDGKSTVGTHLDISHSAPSPIGIEVTCETELIEIDRRRLVFTVVVRDSAGEIGSGKHERFIVDNEKFLSKAESRL